MVRYRIDPTRSRLGIAAKSNIHPIQAEADGLEGWLDVELDDAGILVDGADAKGRVELAVARLRSDNLLADRQWRRHVDARKFPIIVGELTDIGRTDVDHHYRASGDITFHGVTCPQDDHLVFTVDGPDELEITGSAVFDIRDYGLQPPRILLARVEPEVRVTVAITACRED